MSGIRSPSERFLSQYHSHFGSWLRENLTAGGERIARRHIRRVVGPLLDAVHRELHALAIFLDSSISQIRRNENSLAHDTDAAGPGLGEHHAIPASGAPASLKCETGRI